MIKYDSLERNCMCSRMHRWIEIITKFENKENIFYYSNDWYDDGFIEDNLEEYNGYYKSSLMLNTPCLDSWNYEWWYNDRKNSCFRYWSYHIEHRHTLVFLQNALWNCLQRKKLKKEDEFYTLMYNILPKDSVYYISDFVGTTRNWSYYLNNKKKLVLPVCKNYE